MDFVGIAAGHLHLHGMSPCCRAAPLAAPWRQAAGRPWNRACEPPWNRSGEVLAWLRCPPRPAAAAERSPAGRAGGGARGPAPGVAPVEEDPGPAGLPGGHRPAACPRLPVLAAVGRDRRPPRGRCAGASASCVGAGWGRRGAAHPGRSRAGGVPARRRRGGRRRGGGGAGPWAGRAGRRSPAPAGGGVPWAVPGGHRSGRLRRLPGLVRGRARALAGGPRPAAASAGRSPGVRSPPRRWRSPASWSGWRRRTRRPAPRWCACCWPAATGRRPRPTTASARSRPGGKGPPANCTRPGARPPPPRRSPRRRPAARCRRR